MGPIIYVQIYTQYWLRGISVTPTQMRANDITKYRLSGLAAYISGVSTMTAMLPDVVTGNSRKQNIKKDHSMLNLYPSIKAGCPHATSCVWGKEKTRQQ